MNKPSILRRRYIPDEIVDISKDELLYRDEELLVTRWKAIKPRSDFASGISYTFLNKGYKISRFFDGAGNFLYWYCDIIDVEYRADTDTYTLKDLLTDVKMMPDGRLIVLDTDELAGALEKGLITVQQACSSMRILDTLLRMVYTNQFPPEICRDGQYTID